MTPTLVPRAWPGETVVILAGGPSLTQADVDACRGKARVIAIKEAVRLAPWADVMYACDWKWWLHFHKALPFDGPKYALDTMSRPYAMPLMHTGELGLELSPDGLRSGRSSGYQAINLAVHFGAAKIILLGYDMQPGPTGALHWFHDRPPSYPGKPITRDVFRSWTDSCFPTIVEPLEQLGIEVVNASRVSALTVFPRLTIDEALEAVAA